jgi:processing peptidase subunit beta
MQVALARGAPLLSLARRLPLARRLSLSLSSSLSSLSSYPESVLAAPECQVTTLPNGVRVVSEAGTGDVVSLCVAVDSGSRFETASSSGMSHLIAQAGFAGKESEVALMGGHFTARAGRESTAFQATVHKSHAAKALGVLAHAAKGAAVASAGALEKAKGAALCELEGSVDSPERHLLEHLHDAAFLDTAMAMPVMGTAPSVESISSSDVSAFVARNFTGPRVVVSGAGGVEHAALADASSSLLGSLPSTPPGGLEAPMEPGFFVGSDKRMRFDSKPVAHVALAFQGAAATSEYAVPLQLLQAVLGSWDRRSNVGNDGASRWSIDLAEHELAHRAGSFGFAYKDAGLIGVMGVAPDNKLDDFMWHTLDNVVRLCHNLTDEEVERAATSLKSSRLLSTASATAGAADLAGQMLSHGRCVSAAEFFARVDALSTADVKSTAMDFIHDQDHALAAVGPIFELPDYNWIRRRSMWLRY